MTGKVAKRTRVGLNGRRQCEASNGAEPVGWDLPAGYWVGSDRGVRAEGPSGATAER